MTTPHHHGEDEAAFMARVRRALASDLTKAARPGNSEIPRLVQRSDERVERFDTTARAAGMLVARATVAAAAEVIAGVLKQHGGSTIAVGASTSEFESLAARAVTAAGIACGRIAGDETTENLGAYFAADIGLTDVVHAVAETGSIVLASSSGRGGYLVPPVHVAVVKASQIQADLLDLGECLSELAQSAAAITIVSGPSKTADIEGVLITGVHGPGVVHIVMITDA